MRSILFFLALAALAGCGTGTPLPPETDAAKGREILKAVLEKWKTGGTAAELKTAPRPVVVRDPDWEAGAKLTAYEIGPENGRHGVDLMLTVKLTLARADGKAREKTVSYIVAVGDATVVIRNE